MVVVAKILKKNNKNVTIDVIGYGKNFSFLQGCIKEYKLEKYLNLYGYILPSKTVKYYSRSNALLITLSKGLGISKTIPSKFQTYLAYGRPLLICSDGEINYLVKKNYLGLVSQAGDVNLLYKNIMKLKKMNDSEYRKISLNCYNFYIKKYLLTNKVQELEKIFLNILKV
jgi:glycosyltransferase involved in cell wall biosynthesis